MGVDEESSARRERACDGGAGRIPIPRNSGDERCYSHLTENGEGLSFEGRVHYLHGPNANPLRARLSTAIADLLLWAADQPPIPPEKRTPPT